MNDVTVYLSGPMTGLPEYNIPAFNAEATRLRECGFKVLNPADPMPDEDAVRKLENPDARFRAYMSRDLSWICVSDVVAQLPGWEKSRGATLEAAVAISLGVVITPAWTLSEAVRKSLALTFVAQECNPANQLPSRSVCELASLHPNLRAYLEVIESSREKVKQERAALTRLAHSLIEALEEDAANRAIVASAREILHRFAQSRGIS